MTKTCELCGEYFEGHMNRKYCEPCQIEKHREYRRLSNKRLLSVTQKKGNSYSNSTFQTIVDLQENREEREKILIEMGIIKRRPEKCETRFNIY